MLHRANGTRAVAWGDDEGSGPGQSQPASPRVCASVCQRRLTPTIIPPSAGMETTSHSPEAKGINKGWAALVKIAFGLICA